MLITDQFTSAIIAAYGNHNKDEPCLGEEMSPTDLVCHGNTVLDVLLTLHVGIFSSRDKFNFASIVLFCCMTMLSETDRQTDRKRPLIKLKISSYCSSGSCG